MNKKEAAKNALRKSIKLKAGRRFDPATERMAFRVTPKEKEEIQEAAIAEGRSDSNYIRGVLLKHLRPPPPHPLRTTR